ncbi:XK-related protein 2 [Heteronotia binoei]|uniref:XK-related protein 2 n=1 Tax=Heteronotia binoei TaxID=13085 RepID=UPI00292DFD2E|nr:XK-related protein 2 [Heteronotia binoei]
MWPAKTPSPHLGSKVFFREDSPGAGRLLDSRMDAVCESSIGECSDPPSGKEVKLPPPSIVLQLEPKAFSQVKLPYSIILTTLLYCGEFVSAAVLTASYGHSNDQYWQLLTLFFMLTPSIMDQFTLIFVHRDLTSDKPMILCMHLLLLGPLIRCLEALMIYCRLGIEEEPYVTITRKKRLRKDSETEVEQEVGQSLRRLVTHRNAFKRMAVIQAFLGSTPQLTLQLYISVVEQYVPTTRAVLMSICLVSVTYGALVCNILAIQIKYDDYKICLRPLGFICIILWRSLEISSRITVLVFFGSVFKQYALGVGVANFLVFFFLPWIHFWRSGAQLPDQVEKNFSQVGTISVLCSITLLYAGINVFCWSAVQLRLSDRDLISKSQSWNYLVFYYLLRGVENIALIILWYLFKTDFYEYICMPFLVVQLIVVYCLAITFMLFFYQYFHPCRRLFTHNISDFLECVCCKCRQTASASQLEPPYEPGVRHSVV